MDVNGPKLQNVKDVVTLMCAHLFSWPETFYIRERKLVTCVFWHVKTTDVDHHTKYLCDYVKGSQNLHCVKFVSILNVNKMLENDLSCFCCFCLNSDYKNCVNLA